MQLFKKSFFEIKFFTDMQRFILAEILTLRTILKTELHFFKTMFKNCNNNIFLFYRKVLIFSTFCEIIPVWFLLCI